MGGLSDVRFLRAGRALALLGVAIAVVAFLGDLLGLPALATYVEGRPLMQPLTAMSIMVAGAAIAYRCHEKHRATERAVSVIAGALLVAVGLATGIEYVAGVDLGIDWLPFRAPATWPHPGRPSPITSLALIPLGGALMLFDVVLPRGIRAREWLLFVVLFFAFVALVGHLFGAGALYELADLPVIGVALPTVIALHLVSVAALLARPRIGLMRLITSDGPGGVLVRRLGAAAAVAAPLFGALLLALVRRLEVRDLELILAIGTVAGVFFALLLLVITAIPLERSHQAELVARRRVSELLEQAPLGVFMATLDGRYTEVNTAGCRLLGFPREEIVGKTIVELIPESDVERLHRSRERMIAGAVDVDDWQLRRRDGSYVPVEVTAKILSDGRWQGFVSDITARLELERKLRESRDFLTGVLESSTEYGIIAEDLDRRIVLWNEGARRSYGYAHEEILGMRASMLVAQTDLGAWEELRALALDRGTAEGTISARRKDGSSFAAKLVCTRRRGAGNGAAGLLTVSRDLSVEQRNLAEQEFLSHVGIELASCLDYRETVTRVALLATSFLGDVCAVDVLRDGALRRLALVHRDPAGLEHVERSPEVRATVPPSHPMKRAAESREPFVLGGAEGELLEWIATYPEHRPLLESANVRSVVIVPLIARDQLLAILSIGSYDPSRRYGAADLSISQRLASRAALALDNVKLFEQSRLQGAIVTQMAEGVVLIRAADGRIVYANPRFEAMLGYAPRELIGHPISSINAPGELSPEDRAERIMAHLRREGSWHGEIKNVRKDGSELWCAASVVEAEHEEHGKVWVSVHSDITERKLLEEKNATALREKDVLLKEIHHRVKNNLQVISSLFALQRGRTESDTVRTLLDESRMRVQSIALVHEQLYGSADLAGIDLDEYLRGLVPAIHASYGATHVDVEASARDVRLDVEEAVPCALVISELVSNSLKHAFPQGEGKVTIRAHRDDEGFCVLEVADDGRGIPADFDWTAPRSLGLRLVRSLTYQLRGTVELDRSRGTRFVIRFPLRHLGPPRDRRAEQAASLGPEQRF